MFSENSYLSFSFRLPKSVINKNTKQTLLQIRFGEKLQGKSELLEILPGRIPIKINAYKGTAERSPIYCNCNAFLNLNHEIDNTVKIRWPSCKKTYYMVVNNIVKSMSIEDMVKSVQCKNELGSLILNAKSKAMEMLKSYSKKLSTEMCASATYRLYLCPITKFDMKLLGNRFYCKYKFLLE